MKKLLILLPLALLIVAISTYYLPSAPVERPVLPNIHNINNYIKQQESLFTDIVKGAEKTIVWADKENKKTEYAVVYLHGYSATRQESAPLSDLLGKALNANVFHTRLSKHGRTDEVLADATINDWKKDTLEAYEIGRTIGNKVILVSVSTGGTLSAWLSAHENTQALVAQLMLSPNFDIPSQDAYMLDLPLGIGIKFAEWTVGKEHKWEPRNELQEKYWNTSYPIKGVRPMIQLLKTVKKIDKSKVTLPTLMIYSPQDSVILPKAIVENFTSYGSAIKQLTEFTDSEDLSQHVLAGDILSPSTTKPVLDIMLSFLQKNNIAKPHSNLPIENTDNKHQPTEY